MYWINIEKIGYISKISYIFDFFDIFDFFEKIMIFSIPDINTQQYENNTILPIFRRNVLCLQHPQFKLVLSS